MSFEKNDTLENILTEVNRLLAPVEERERNNVGKPEYPNLFLVGTSRCGSTLFTQWAASLGVFSYPSNFLSRFYKAPYVGALIYEIVTNPKYQYKNEFSDIEEEIEFESSIGKTKGFKAPHEFWYFWREFIDFPDIPFSDEEFSQKFNFEDFQKELALIQKAFGKPFLCKAKIVNSYLKSMAEHTENSIFLHMYREPTEVIRSLLKAREKWTGSSDNWFAWKPREYPELITMDRYHQVAGQVYFTEREIRSSREYLGDRYLKFSYKEFCVNPASVYYKISKQIKKLAPSFVITDYHGIEKFNRSENRSAINGAIQVAYTYFLEKYGELENS